MFYSLLTVNLGEFPGLAKGKQ